MGMLAETMLKHIKERKIIMNLKSTVQRESATYINVVRQKGMPSTCYGVALQSSSSGTEGLTYCVAVAGLSGALELWSFHFARLASAQVLHGSSIGANLFAGGLSLER